ncbi:MAG: cytochrome c [Chromatiales bacterium]|jgi:cytochrome c553
MKSHRILSTFPIIFFSVVSFTSVPADELGVGNVEAGRLKSVLCLGCHGMNGEGKRAVDQQLDYPRLSGQVPSYFIKSIYDYKNDRRKDPFMNALTKGLSDIDIANLAAYYASLE